MWCPSPSYPKKCGGLRPIAIGEALRRLTSKCLAFSARPSIQPRFLPHQLGVGIKGACEAIVHTVSRLFASKPDNQCWTLLLDFSNAFNSTDHSQMFVEFRNQFPSLSPPGWKRVTPANQTFCLATTPCTAAVAFNKVTPSNPSASLSLYNQSLTPFNPKFLNCPSAPCT